jgi:poly-gamma-glutamate capsule biosynthesis protein CapA/YwtB (metallophosphatase superfamily)
LRAADIAIANLECAVSTRGSPLPDKLYTFRGQPAALRAAARFAGIDVVSLANNHTLDYGRTAFVDTIRHARAFGLAQVGGGTNLRAARRATIRRQGGVRIAFLGFSDVRPLGSDAGPGTSGTSPAFPSYVDESVRAARRRADVVLVYFHWGIERANRPSSRQDSLARVAFGAGAHIVVGAHPHVLQPIRRVGARRLVAWSLGNFVFAAHSPGTRNTGILRLNLGAKGVLGYGFVRARIGGAYGVQPQLFR